MTEIQAVLIATGVLVPFYAIFRNPKRYFSGLFMSVFNREKTQGLFLLIVVFCLISVPMVYLMNYSWESTDILAVSLLALAMIWKTIEIFRSPGSYISGLFKKGDEEGKSSWEPISLWLISVVVIITYLLEGGVF